MEQVTVVQIVLFAPGVVANTLHKNLKLLGHKEGIINNIQRTAALEKCHSLQICVFGSNY
jgi:hypothetical protein